MTVQLSDLQFATDLDLLDVLEDETSSLSVKQEARRELIVRTNNRLA